MIGIGVVSKSHRRPWLLRERGIVVSLMILYEFFSGEVLEEGEER